MAVRKERFEDEQQDRTEESKEEKKPQQQRRPVTKEAIERLQKFREELMEGRNGELFEDSTEILRQEREKRTQHLMDVVEGRVE